MGALDARRLAYLEAMQIDVWQRRDLPAAAMADESAVVEAEQDRPAAALLRQSPPTVTTPLPATANPDAIDAPSVAGMARDAGAAAGLQPQALQLDEGMPATGPAVSDMGWGELETAVRDCTRCPLHATRTNPVFGVGDRQARWMIIGEAPGADEDRQGEPFVGRAGQLLNVMLKSIGLAREQVFIANILKSRPPNNRDPRPEEVRACLPYLYRQIELVDPQILLCVGRIAAQTLLDVTTPIGKLRGKVHTIAGGRPMVVTYHPAYLLRSPGEKRKSWADLLLALRTHEAAQPAVGAPA